MDILKRIVTYFHSEVWTWIWLCSMATMIVTWMLGAPSWVAFIVGLVQINLMHLHMALAGPKTEINFNVDREAGTIEVESNVLKH